MRISAAIATLLLCTASLATFDASDADAQIFSRLRARCLQKRCVDCPPCYVRNSCAPTPGEPQPCDPNCPNDCKCKVQKVGNNFYIINDCEDSNCRCPTTTPPGQKNNEVYWLYCSSTSLVDENSISIDVTDLSPPNDNNPAQTTVGRKFKIRADLADYGSDNKIMIHSEIKKGVDLFYIEIEKTRNHKDVMELKPAIDPPIKRALVNLHITGHQFNFYVNRKRKVEIGNWIVTIKYKPKVEASDPGLN